MFKKAAAIVESIACIVMLALLLFMPAKAEQETPGKNGPYVLQRINGKVKLDGYSSETAWQGVEPLPLIMHVPDFGKTPTEKTEILVAYDDNYVYVAGRLYERNPRKIQASSKKRDDMGLSNDWIGIILDTFNDKENALCFFTTPTGLRLDMTVFNDARSGFPLNSSWNTYWDVATVRNNKGWFTEFRIPFSSLRFQDREGNVTMGMITWRWIARNNESIIYPAIPTDWGFWSMFKPSQAKEVVFKGIRSRKPLYIAPYVLAGSSRTFELNEKETAYRHIDDPALDVGLDVKYGLTSNLTLDVTLNTDFAQVEADDQQINLTRFSLFFPEKRLFFQERSSIFDFNFGGFDQLFYSRRIGIYEEKPVRIYGGARLVGRIGPWDLGIISMQTAASQDLAPENFSVLRVRRRVFNPYSYIGTMVTSRIGTDGTFNLAYGLDGIFRLFGDDYLRVNWAQTFENDSKNKPLSLDTARIRLNWERQNLKGFSYNLEYSRSGSGYNPGIGFQSREDYTRFGSQLQFGWGPAEGSKLKLQRHTIFFIGSIHFSNADNSTESTEISPGWAFEAKSGFSGAIVFNRFYENVSEGFSFTDEEEKEADPDILPGRYTFHGVNAFISMPEGRKLNGYVDFYAGTFYDGWRVSAGVYPTWNVSSGLELSGTYQFNYIKFPDRNKQFTAHIARLRLLTMFSIKFSASAFIQYNSAIHTIITNIRLRYNPREGNDLYLVYNEGMNRNRYREDPVLPFSSDRTIMLKYTYTFNLKK
jgi:hypothetical protein